MKRKLICALAGILLLSVSFFLSFVIAYLVSTEILPAIENGSLNVEKSTMILNRVWEGNEIYALLALYTALAGAFAYGAIRLIFRGKKKPAEKRAS